MLQAPHLAIHTLLPKVEELPSEYYLSLWRINVESGCGSAAPALQDRISPRFTLLAHLERIAAINVARDAGSTRTK